MKRVLSVFTALALLGASSALAYTKNSQGLYVDESGNVIEDYWDDAAGIYIVEGVGYDITDADKNPTYEDSAASSGISQNADGSMTIESGSIQIEEPEVTQGAGHLTEEEYWARMNKYTAANGAADGTVYIDGSGNVYPAEVRYLGLGRSTIRVGGQELIVPTSSLKWETEAPEDKLLAVSTPAKQTYLTLRAKKSQKAFVMGHCDKCEVLQVISVGKTWTMVEAMVEDVRGRARGYVLTSGLTFYDNAPREYTPGIITVKGKIIRNDTVHVRSAATNKARQIAEFPLGTPVTVFSQDDTWSEIDVCGLHCYIMNQFVTLQEPMVIATHLEEGPKAEE